MEGKMMVMTEKTWKAIFGVCCGGLVLGGGCLMQLQDIVNPPQAEDCVFTIGDTDIVLPCALFD